MLMLPQGIACRLHPCTHWTCAEKGTCLQGTPSAEHVHARQKFFCQMQQCQQEFVVMQSPVFEHLPEWWTTPSAPVTCVLLGNLHAIILLRLQKARAQDESLPLRARHR